MDEYLRSVAETIGAGHLLIWLGSFASSGLAGGTWALRVVEQLKCQTFSVETSVNGGERDRMTSCDNRAKSQRGERNRSGDRIRDGAGAGFDQGPRLWRLRQGWSGADTRVTVGATV